VYNPHTYPEPEHNTWLHNALGMLVSYPLNSLLLSQTPIPDFPKIVYELDLHFVVCSSFIDVSNDLLVLVLVDVCVYPEMH